MVLKLMLAASLAIPIPPIPDEPANFSAEGKALARLAMIVGYCYNRMEEQAIMDFGRIRQASPYQEFIDGIYFWAIADSQIPSHRPFKLWQCQDMVNWGVDEWMKAKKNEEKAKP